MWKWKENEEMEKEGGNGERMRKWSESERKWREKEEMESKKRKGVRMWKCTENEEMESERGNGVRMWKCRANVSLVSCVSCSSVAWNTAVAILIECCDTVMLAECRKKKTEIIPVFHGAS